MRLRHRKPTELRQIMEPENKTDEEVVTPVVTNTQEDPLKTELEKVQRKGRTQVEKLQYSKKRIEDQLKDLGIQDEEPDDDDSKPLTKGEFKKLQAESATKTALDLAQDVSNETERELIKFHLENTIRSTGNPQQDFELAQGLVNAAKNKQILDESLRKTAKSNGTGPGAPAKVIKPQDDLTAEEMAFLKAPWNMTKEQIIKTRPQ